MEQKKMTSSATRQAKHRARGKTLGLTLSDPKAIAALATLTEKLGSQRAAVEQALISLADKKSPIEFVIVPDYEILTR